MMQPDVAKAHAESLRGWAREWGIEAETVGASPGAGEVSFQLGRTAALIDRIAAGLPFEDAPVPLLPTTMDEVRPG
jgi:hypothetical protein